MSRPEELFALHVRAAKLPEPVREYRFHPVRRWRLDFFWPEPRLAVEVEGGEFIYGRHQRPLGFRRDAEKYNAALEAGIRVLRYTTQMIRSGEAIRQVERVLAA